MHGFDVCFLEGFQEETRTQTFELRRFKRINLKLSTNLDALIRIEVFYCEIVSVDFFVEKL